MSLNFVESLEKTASDIKRPPALPTGTYEWQIKRYDIESSNDGRWDICAFHCVCTGVVEVDDPEALADFGSAPGTYMRYSFMFDTEDRARFDQTQFRLKKFLTDHVQCWSEGNGSGALKEGLANSIGHKFNGLVRWRQDKADPDIQYAEIAKTLPL